MVVNDPVALSFPDWGTCGKSIESNLFYPQDGFTSRHSPPPLVHMQKRHRFRILRLWCRLLADQILCYSGNSSFDDCYAYGSI